jgi:hypothetical protein
MTADVSDPLEGEGVQSLVHYLAVSVSASILVLLLTAWCRRRTPTAS